MSKEYLRQAYEFAAKNSTDRSTQNGAILVDGLGNVVAWGANRFPRGVAETTERMERPAKYLYVVHAELAAILDAARRGVKTEGLTMFAPWSACNECAKSIIGAGIAKVVAHKKIIEASYNQWPDSIRIAMDMFKEAGVLYELYDGEIGGVEILFNGKPFSP